MQKKGFTLIEIIVAVTVLAVILVSIFEAYMRIMEVNRRLTLARGLQESARIITESIADDVRRNGIDFTCYASSLTACWLADYAGSGSAVLATHTAKYYLMEDALVTDPVACSDPEGKKCYLGKELPDGKKVRLTPPTVWIRNLRFFVSWVSSSTFSEPTDTEGKVTLVFSLSPALGAWVESESAKRLVIPVQTTISEKLYKAH